VRTVLDFLMEIYTGFELIEKKVEFSSACAFVLSRAERLVHEPVESGEGKKRVT